MDLKLNVSKKGLSTTEEVITEEYTLRYGHIFRGIKGNTGEKGDNGKSPQISNNGTWLVFSDELETYVDTGIKASGSDNNYNDTDKALVSSIATLENNMATNTAAINELQGEVLTNKDPMHDVYLSYYGVSYDETTKLYSVGYLTDLTADDMRKAFAMYGGGIASAAFNSWINSYGDFESMKDKLPRTTLPVYASGSRLLYDQIHLSFCWGRLEQISLGYVPTTPDEYNTLKIWQYDSSETQLKLTAMLNLKYIVDPLWCNESHQLDIFGTLEQLREIRLLNLQGDVLFNKAKNLSKVSLLYMINNCASNATFTIVLDSDVYDKCYDDGEWTGEIESAVDDADINKSTTVILASA